MAECASALGDLIMQPAFNLMSAWEAFAGAWDRCRGTGGCSLWGEQTWDRSSQPRGATAKPPTLLRPRLLGALGACQGHGTPAMALRSPAVPTLVKRGVRKGARGMGEQDQGQDQG